MKQLEQSKSELEEDIAKRIRTEAAFLETQDLLNDVGKIAKIGGWKMDLISRKAVWTLGTYDIVEIPHGDPVPGPDEHVNYYLPDYRPLVIESMRALIEDDKPLDFEAQLRTVKGNVKWCRAMARAVRKEGKAIEVYGTFQDITDRKQAEEELQFRNVLLTTQQESSIDGILVVDENAIILSYNRRMIEMWNLPHKIVEDGLDEPALRFVTDQMADPKAFARRVQHLYKHRLETGRDEVVLKDGRVFDRYSAPMLGPKEKYYGRVWYFRDITDHKRAEARIRKLLAMQATIRQVNEALLRTDSEEGLYQRICDLLLNLEGIKLAWIGLIQKDSTDLMPVAKSGEKSYLSVVKFTRDDSEYGQGPAGLALRSGQPCIIGDIETDDRYKSWRDEARKRGFASVAAIPLIESGGTMIGALGLYSGTPDAFGDEEIKLLLEVSSDIAVGVKAIRLERQVGQAIQKLKKSFKGTIETISLMSEIRDPYTSGHERKVAQLSREIGREMGLAEDRLEGIQVIGFLHDIGKIAVPAEILTKPGRLNANELNLIKVHPKTGYDILKGLEFSWPVAETILQHHERLNGSGYPSGLKGDQIGLEARILAVADVVEAMASHRPYRPALGIERALEEIVRGKGVLFDPAVVEACLAVFKKGFEFL